MVIVICYYIISYFKSIQEVYEPILFAALSGALGYVLHKFGGYDFIVNSSHITMEAERGGLIRFMIGNGDYNFYGAFVIVGFAIALALLFFVEMKQWKRLFIALSLLVFIPALLSTVSRGAILNMFFIAICCIITIFQNKVFSLKHLVGLSIGGSIIVFLLYPMIHQYVSNIIDFQRETAENSRTELVRMYMQYIEKYFILGIQGLDLNIKMAAHNTFVETFANYGVIIFGIFIKLLIQPFRGDILNFSFLPLRIAYVSILVSFLSLSIFGFKVFWIILFIILFYEKKLYGF